MAQIRLYVDEDSMDRRLISALRQHGVDVVTVQDEGRRGLPDAAQLEWATEHNRVLYTQNASDYQQLHTEILHSGRHHGGIVILTGRNHSVGDQLRGLLAIMAARTAEDMRDALEFLTAWR
ncbi:MAG: DUF5615 family PIN-like protein [Acidimicrobiales bacterium]